MNTQEHTVSSAKPTSAARGSANTALARFESATADSRIRRLVELGRVPEARALAEDSPTWKKLLSRPTVKLTPSSDRRDFVANMSWVKSHRVDFLGKWVALRNGELVLSAESFRALHASLERDGMLRTVLVTLVQ